MSIPLPEDLEVEDGTDEERAEAIGVAIRVAELLAGRAILDRELRQDVYLGGTSPHVVLDYFPMSRTRIDGAESPRGFWIEPTAGIVGAYHGVAPASYRVDFLVGCESEIPVILEVLIQRIAEHQLGAGPGASAIMDVGASSAAMLNLPAMDRAQYREKVV